MKTTTIVLLAGIAFTAPAMAQTYYTTPNVYGQPGYGSTTIGPEGLYHTTPNVYGRPEFGSTTFGPNNDMYRTTPNVYGQPQYGSTTTRY
jgi:hypothetical protein